MKQQLLIPMAVYVFYIFCLAFLNFRTRLLAIKTGQVSPKFFKSYIGDAIPERVTIVGRHYDNQFQLPMLFFIGGTLAIALDQITTLTVILAWLFVVSRWAHSWVHLGSNKLQKRVAAFGAGWILVVLFWGYLLAGALVSPF